MSTGWNVAFAGMVNTLDSWKSGKGKSQHTQGFQEKKM